MLAGPFPPQSAGRIRLVVMIICLVLLTPAVSLREVVDGTDELTAASMTSLKSLGCSLSTTYLHGAIGEVKPYAGKKYNSAEELYADGSAYNPRTRRWVKVAAQEKKMVSKTNEMLVVRLGWGRGRRWSEWPWNSKPWLPRCRGCDRRLLVHLSRVR